MSARTIALTTVAVVAEEPEVASGSSASTIFDRAFIDAMVPHHRSAIEMAQKAKAAGLLQAELVEIADSVITTQQQEIDQMLEWREMWFGPGQLGPIDAATLGLSESELAIMEHSANELTEAENVDQAFATMMSEHHRGAVAMASAALERAEHEEINALAAAIVEGQAREIETMEPFIGGEHHE